MTFSTRILSLANLSGIAGALLSSVALGQPPACVDEVATHYGVDVRIVRAILRVEGGRVGMRSPNTNGTYDLGPMQINTLWLDTLRARGIGEAALTWDYCTNVAVGTWILARELNASRAPINTPEYWAAVGRYHSRTPHLNVRYAVKVWSKAKQAASAAPVAAAASR